MSDWSSRQGRLALIAARGADDSTLHPHREAADDLVGWLDPEFDPPTVGLMGGRSIRHALRRADYSVVHVPFGFPLSVLRRHEPQALVIEETWLVHSRWASEIDSMGTPWGRLDQVLDWFDSQNGSIYVMAAPTPVVQIRQAVYLPNVTVAETLKDTEFPDRLMEVLQNLGMRGQPR